MNYPRESPWLILPPDAHRVHPRRDAQARYEMMEDGRFFATIPSCEGLWADGDTLEATREQLQSVLEDWILIKARHGDRFPVIGGADINPQPAYAEPDKAGALGLDIPHEQLGCVSLSRVRLLCILRPVRQLRHLSNLFLGGRYLAACVPAIT
jgi:predicted RNase H-like HicB family nuclease